MTKILCLIPARSGSKGIPHKNIKDFKGKPLLAWSIEQAQNSKYQMKIIVQILFYILDPHNHVVK